MDEKPRVTHHGSEKRQRNVVVQMRCNDGERAMLNTAAERAGMSVTMFIRHQCFGTKPPRAARRPTVEGGLLADMVWKLAQLVGSQNKIGSNVNQIARVLNSGGDVPLDTITAALREVEESTAEVRAASRAVIALALGTPRRG